MGEINEEYPFLIKDTVKGKDITIMGIEHSLESDENFFNTYRTFFEHEVLNNEALVFEQPIEGRFWKSPFFRILADLAYLSDKTIYLVDPVNSATTIFDTGMAIGGAGLFAFETATTVNRSVRKNLSRRNFLRKSVLGIVGASTFLGSTFGLSLRANINEESVIEYGIDDYILTYGEMDYRNLVIGEGIETILKYSNTENLLVVHGDLHSQGIHAYLKNPELRTKKRLYFPFELLGRKKIRKYVPDRKHFWEWILNEEF